RRTGPPRVRIAAERHVDLPRLLRCSIGEHLVLGDRAHTPVLEPPLLRLALTSFEHQHALIRKSLEEFVQKEGTREAGTRHHHVVVMISHMLPRPRRNTA